MLIDSIGIAFFPDLLILRLVGRLAFPIFAFCVAETVKKGENIDGFVNRLFTLALLSQFPYLFFRPDVRLEGFSPLNALLYSYLPGLRGIPGLMHPIPPAIENSPGLNACFTLAMAVVAIKFLRQTREEKKDKGKTLILFALILMILWSAYFLRVDFGAYGVAMVLLFYNHPIREKGLFAKMLMILPLLVNLLSMLIQSLTVAALPLIRLLEEIKPDILPAWVYALAYPLHFILIGLILHRGLPF